MNSKVVLITAAVSGLGAAVARKLTADGCRVALFSLSSRAEALAQELGS